VKKKIVIIFAAVFFGWLAIFGVAAAINLFSWRDEYIEAEPYVEVIWPLSSEIREFEKERGRRPKSLAELEQFAGLDLTKIATFQHRFYEKGSLVFTIKINETHGFKIDDSFSPAWNVQK
jgi:hypothetical protein